MDIVAQLRAGALDLAPRLLGWELVTLVGGAQTAGRIVEVEAYHGAEDPASHAFRGPSVRNTPMFSGGGYVYTYRSYGIHICMNIVAGPGGTAQAILIRAVEPNVGLEIMAARRGLTNPLLLARGPGRLTQALGITLQDSGSLLGAKISLRPPATPLSAKDIVTSARVGISAAQDLPWRFYIKDNPFVSGPRTVAR